MKLQRAVRVTLTLAFVTFALAASASSALAVSVEPLKTKFSGTSTNFAISLGPGTSLAKCKKTSFEGTTESTKVNFTGMTLAFSECSNPLPDTVEIHNRYKNCTTPWTVTFSAGGKAKAKLNCELEALLVAGGCHVYIAAGAETNEVVDWANGTKALNLNLDAAHVNYTSEPLEGFCEGLYGVHPSGELFLTGTVSLKGIEVH